MSTAIVVATMALQGAAVGVSCELAVRSFFRKKDKNTKIKVAKFFLGLCMAIKSVLFLSFHSDQGNGCYATGRVADLFYHFAMTAGTFVLVTRVQSIVPIEWRKRGFIFHTTLSVLRLLIGVVDVVLINVGVAPDGTCQYSDKEFWGPVYTLYDTVIDLYVTMIISVILISHIRALELDKMKVNTLLYSSVIYHNVIRTVCLTIVNLISAIFIIINTQVPAIMVLWPIINIFFVILVGYDSDVAKAIRKLQQRRWRKISHISTVDLTCVPSISRINSKRPLSVICHSDPELQIQTAGGDVDENFDMSLLHIERCKSTFSRNSVAQNGSSNRRHSLPNITYQQPSA